MGRTGERQGGHWKKGGGGGRWVILLSLDLMLFLEDPVAEGGGRNLQL